METQTILADHDRQFSWHNYNESQTKEKTLLINILKDICDLIEEPKHEKGRRPTKTRDIIFALVLKQYLNTSSRRLQSDLGLFKEAGLIDELGGQAFIPFKKNATGRRCATDRGLYKSMLRYFKDNREKFMLHYHKRSNIESTFSMIKRRFGNNVKCKKEISQDNEILGKILAHNICVLIQEIFLNKIELDFNYHAEHYVARN